jgi:hypothetical protein
MKVQMSRPFQLSPFEIKNSFPIPQHYIKQYTLFDKMWPDLELCFRNARGIANYLYKGGYLSFDPYLIEDLDDNQAREFEFLYIVLTKHYWHISRLNCWHNGNLSKPYCYDIRQMYWHTESNAWLYIPILMSFQSPYTSHILQDD